MRTAKRLTLSEHVAEVLSDGLRKGQWAGRIPGVRVLAKELNVSRDTIRDALRLLETKQVLSHSGAGRSRLIAAHVEEDSNRVVRVGVLLPGPLELDNRHTNELILASRQAIEAIGHVCFIGEKTARGFGFNPRSIRRYMETCNADAWIVYSGRRELLETVSGAPFPVFALGGDSMGLGLASSRANLKPAIDDCVDTLVNQGHRRIVLISPDKWRLPRPNSSATAFLDRLRHHGLPADTNYNLPAWDHTPSGLNSLLKSLYFATPPTALLVLEPECVGPVMIFLAERGLRVPDHVSIVNILPDPMQAFYACTLAHVRWPLDPHVKSITRWVNALARGEVYRTEKTSEPKFILGESIGPARVKR